MNVLRVKKTEAGKADAIVLAGVSGSVAVIVRDTLNRQAGQTGYLYKVAEEPKK